MKGRKRIQGMTASQICYCEEIKGRELEAIRSNNGSLEAQVI